MSTGAYETATGVVAVNGNNPADYLDTIEKPFYYLGLTTPTKRFLGTGVLAAMVLMALKPRGLFTKDGQPKPMKFTHPDSPTAVWVPWWGYAVAVGLTFAIVI